MINVNLRTSLDITEVWPQKLPEVPRVGDFVQSSVRHKDGFQLTLKVVSVTWKLISNDRWEPFIELHTINRESISEFYKWYAPLVGKSVSAFI